GAARIKYTATFVDVDGSRLRSHELCQHAPAPLDLRVLEGGEAFFQDALRVGAISAKFICPYDVVTSASEPCNLLFASATRDGPLLKERNDVLFVFRIVQRFPFEHLVAPISFDLKNHSKDEIACAQDSLEPRLLFPATRFLPEESANAFSWSQRHVQWI